MAAAVFNRLLCRRLDFALRLQTYFAAPRVETITYSQFKTLVKKGLVSNVVIGEKVIRGDIKPEGLKEVLSAEHLKELNEKDKEDTITLYCCASR